MGFVPIAAAFGALVAVVLSPLTVWAFRGLDTERALDSGVILFAFLSTYMLVSGLIAEFVGNYTLSMLLTYPLPVILAVGGLVCIAAIER